MRGAAQGEIKALADGKTEALIVVIAGRQCRQATDCIPAACVEVSSFL